MAGAPAGRATIGAGMLKQQARAVAASLYAADLASTLARPRRRPTSSGARSCRASSRSGCPTLYPFTWYLVLVGPIVVIWTGLLFLSGAYRSRRTVGAARTRRS